MCIFTVSDYLSMFFVFIICIDEATAMNYERISVLWFCYMERLKSEMNAAVCCVQGLWAGEQGRYSCLHPWQTR